MSTIKITGIYFLLLFLLIPSNTWGQELKNTQTDYSILIKELDIDLRKKMRAYNVVGMSIALIDGNKIIWSKGFGYENKAANIYASPRTLNYGL